MSAPDDFVPPAPLPAHSSGFYLPVAAIHVPPRIRAVDGAWVQTLAASFEDKGMDTPITVRPVEGADGHVTYSLVIGAHRLAAAKVLDWPNIRTLIRHFTDDEARLAEITENLERRELDKLDFGIFYIERKEVEERLGLRNSHGGDRRSGAGNGKSQNLATCPGSGRFTAEIADKIGRSERSVQLTIQIVKALDPETIELIRGTRLANNESNLVKLGREQNPIKRRALAQAMLDGAPTIQAARVAIGDEDAPSGDPQPVYLAQLHTAWAKADLATRQLFLDDIDAAFLTMPTEAEAKADRRAAAKAAPAPAQGRQSRKGVR